MTTENKAGDVIISVRNLEKHFKGGELKALNGVDTDIHRGEVLPEPAGAANEGYHQL